MYIPSPRPFGFGVTSTGANDPVWFAAPAWPAAPSGLAAVLCPSASTGATHSAAARIPILLPEKIRLEGFIALSIDIELILENVTYSPLPFPENRRLFSCQPPKTLKIPPTHTNQSR
jgi:hypothetical protein